MRYWLAIVVALVHASLARPADPNEEKWPLTAIAARATLKGKVTITEIPADLQERTRRIQKLMEWHKDREECLKGTDSEKSQQDYRISKNNGLAEVFVWVKPPYGQRFLLEPRDLKLKNVKPGEWDIKADEVILDQPHGAFIPHAFAVFPKYYDGNSMILTGQSIVVKNSAEFMHNANWKGSTKNRGDNKIIPPKRQLEVPALNPDEIPVVFKSDMHTWMQAICRVYDHPFAAITDRDGNFEIKDVPADMDLQLIAWHPAIGYLNGHNGGTIRFLEGKTEVVNFDAKAR